MKPLILPLLLLATAVLGFASEEDPYRTFTDNEGRTVRAVIVRTSAEEVWIRRDDGRTFRVAISTFSKPDRDFISQWRVMRSLQAPNSLTFSVRRYSDRREVSVTRTRRTTTEYFGYIVTVTNRTAIDLANIDIDYHYFALRGTADVTGQNRPRERFTDRTRIEELPARGSVEFKTPPIPLVSTSLRAGRTTEQRRSNDDLGGIWIRLIHDRNVISEFSSPSNLKENETW